MSKFTFVCQEEAMPFASSVDAKRTVEFEAETLEDIVSEFENFLRGCGFYFKGQLSFDDREELEFVTLQAAKQNFDFSEIPKNNWPFQNEQIKPLTVADLEKLNKFNFEMPGTLGGAKVTFASEK